MPRLFLATALLALWATPAVAKLEVQNVQTSYGPLGPVREAEDYYPNDTIHVRFTVKGVRADSDGICDIEIDLSILDNSGKEVYTERLPRKGPRPAFGINSLPLAVFAALPGDAIPGEYVFKVALKDNISGEEAAVEKRFRVKSGQFAIVSPCFFHDAALTLPAPAAGAVGEVLRFRLGAVGFDCSQGKIDTEMTFQVFDKDNMPLLPKPATFVIASADEQRVREARTCDFHGGLQLTKPGEFTLRVTVTDRIGKKTATFEAPLKVTAP